LTQRNVCTLQFMTNRLSTLGHQSKKILIAFRHISDSWKLQPILMVRKVQLHVLFAI
jgi:hypothetical protein